VIDRGQRRIRPVGVLLVLAMTLGLTACGTIQPKGSYPADDPRSAVHQFLRATVGQANGQRACALMTEAARQEMAARAGTCRAAMDKAIVALQGAPPTGEGTGRAAEDVELEARTDGDRATIDVFRGRGPRMTFDVVRLSPDELEQDTRDADRAVGSAPESEWRIDAGAEQLVTETNRPAIPSPEPDPRG
jgi:hypothetical protein